MTSSYRYDDMLVAFEDDKDKDVKLSFSGTQNSKTENMYENLATPGGIASGLERTFREKANKQIPVYLCIMSLVLFTIICAVLTSVITVQLHQQGKNYVSERVSTPKAQQDDNETKHIWSAIGDIQGGIARWQAQGKEVKKNVDKIANESKNLRDQLESILTMSDTSGETFDETNQTIYGELEKFQNAMDKKLDEWFIKTNETLFNETKAWVDVLAPSGKKAAQGCVMKVGTKVKVKDGATPRYGWGKATPSSVGTIRSVRSGGKLTIDFPEQSGWSGLTSEMKCA